MAVTSAPDSQREIDPLVVGAAVGITADTGADYTFTDAYGVTYTGAPAHLALSVLARPDRTGGIYPDQPAVAAGIRATACTLIDWFTSQHTDPEHTAEFAALPPMRVCELVVYLLLHGDAKALGKVGPNSLHHYTDHLLHDPVPSPDHPLPELIDQPCFSLAGSDGSPQTRLQVTATARGGADEVAVPMEIEASEQIHWEVAVSVRVPVNELNGLLMDPEYFAGEYLASNIELIEHHLGYSDGDTEGPAVTGRLTHPHAAAVTDTLGGDPDPDPVSLELFFVGPDRDTALRTAPFGTRELAEYCAGRNDDRIFRASIQVTADAMRLLT